MDWRLPPVADRAPHGAVLAPLRAAGPPSPAPLSRRPQHRNPSRFYLMTSVKPHAPRPHQGARAVIATRWQKFLETGVPRGDGACPKLDTGLRAAMGHVRKWTRACASRWGMSEIGHGSARGDWACPKLDMGLRAAMGHVRSWTWVCASRWGMSEIGHGSARGDGACPELDKGGPARRKGTWKSLNTAPSLTA